MHYPKIYIIGAGCGDPELLTLKAARLLAAAEVVITDRLVSKKILDRHCNENCQIVLTGKQGFNAKSYSQGQINDLLIHYIQQNKRVVRLKGGDVSVFSNILDELETLSNHNISYEIVPGITAAIGAAAYTGIPLTARGHSQAVRLITLQKDEQKPDEYWRELAKTSDTLVFYMNVHRNHQIFAELKKHTENRPLAVIENATTPQQRVFVSDLMSYEEDFKGIEFKTPALLVIGDVVQMHRKYQWFQTQTIPYKEVFQTLQ